MSGSSLLSVAFATVALFMIVTARFAERFATRWGIPGCALRGALQDFSDMAGTTWPLIAYTGGMAALTLVLLTCLARAEAQT